MRADANDGVFGMVVYGFVYTFVMPLLPKHSVILDEEDDEEEAAEDIRYP